MRTTAITIHRITLQGRPTSAGLVRLPLNPIGIHPRIVALHQHHLHTSARPWAPKPNANSHSTTFSTAVGQGRVKTRIAQQAVAHLVSLVAAEKAALRPRKSVSVLCMAIPQIICRGIQKCPKGAKVTSGRSRLAHHHLHPR